MKTLKQTCQIINTKKIKIFGVLFMVLFLQSCMKEEYDKVEHKTNYYYLTTAQLNQTPYFTNPTFNTISFASDKGDTLTFVKTKTDTTWYCEQGSGNPNTGYDKDCYQTIHNTYATVKGNGSFDVTHYKKEGGITDIIYLGLNNNFLSFGDDQIGYKGYWTFRKSISVSNKSFSNVIIIYPNNYDSLVAEGYVNKDLGLFYYVDKLNNTQYLILK
jgi:hypothetical protein